jgi:hypothetical protein
MKVGEEDMTNLNALSLGVCQIQINVSLRIDDCRSPAGFIRDQIGGVRQTTEIVLFQDHYRSPNSKRYVILR